MSCNDVCVDMDFDGNAEFSNFSTRRAAKPYRCIECGDAIAKGDLHEYVAGKCEGDFYSARTCAACAEIRNVFCCNGWVLEMLWESIREQLFPAWDEITQIDCLAKLTTDEAIAKMRARYAEYVGDRS